MIEDKNSPGMSPGQAVEDGNEERTSPASDTEESAGAGPGPGDGVESSPARGTDITQDAKMLADIKARVQGKRGET